MVKLKGYRDMRERGDKTRRCPRKAATDRGLQSKTYDKNLHCIDIIAENAMSDNNLSEIYGRKSN